MIEISIAKDKELNSISEFAQLLYLKILPHTDDFGRMEGDPEIVKVCVDGFSKRPIKDYVSAMKEISEAGLWVWYETDKNKKVIQYNAASFERINAFLIKKRGNPEYPEYKEGLYKLISNDIDVYAPINNIKYKDKVISNKHKDKDIDPLIEEKFNQFWDRYPRKTGKQPCKKTFIKLNPDNELFDNIILAIENQTKFSMISNNQYTPHPATWLNQERWNDMIITEKSNGKTTDSNFRKFAKGATKDDLASVATERFLRNGY